MKIQGLKSIVSEFDTSSPTRMSRIVQMFAFIYFENKMNVFLNFTEISCKRTMN